MSSDNIQSTCSFYQRYIICETYKTNGKKAEKDSIPLLSYNLLFSQTEISERVDKARQWSDSVLMKRQDLSKITFLPPVSIPNISFLLFSFFWENNILRYHPYVDPPGIPLIDLLIRIPFHSQIILTNSSSTLPLSPLFEVRAIIYQSYFMKQVVKYYIVLIKTIWYFTLCS